MVQSANQIRLDFDALPLVEAAVRVRLNPPLAVTFGFVNKLHEQLRERFSKLTEPDGFEQPPGGIGAGLSIDWKILGAVFSGNVQGLEVSLNPHLVAVRWRKLADDTPSYPRFSVLKKTLIEVLGYIRDLQPSVQASIANMLYVNIIQPKSEQGILRHYFTELVRVKAMEAGSPLELVLSWREQENRDIRFHLTQIQIQQQPAGQEKGLKLATAAGVFLRNENLDEVFDQIHNRLQVFFRDILSEEAKKEWKLTEVSLG